MFKLCRICLSENIKYGVILLKDCERSREIIQKVQLCTQVLITIQEYLPCYICKSCLSDLNIANEIRVKCLASELALKSYCTNLLEAYRPKTELHKTEIITEDSVNIDCGLDLRTESVSQDIKHEVIELKRIDVDTLSDTDYLEIDNDVLANKDSPEIQLETEDKTTIIKESSMRLRENYFQCKICEKQLKTKLSLSKHIESMHEKRKHPGYVTGHGINRTYHCKQCDFATKHSQTLIYHIRRHSGERPYVCECGKRFTQPASLASHKKTHSEKTYFTCPLCGKQFKHKETFEGHKRVHAPASFFCPLCRKGLKSQSSLQSHLDRHYDVKNFSCEDCGATFVTYTELSNHKKTHDMNRKFQCHLCGYKSYLKKSLIVHLLRHTGERAHKCNLCEVACYTKSELKSHRRRHSKDKHYACPLCVQHFAHGPSVNKHVKTVHGIQNWTKDINRRTIQVIS